MQTRSLLISRKKVTAADMQEAWHILLARRPISITVGSVRHLAEAAGSAGFNDIESKWTALINEATRRLDGAAREKPGSRY